MKRTPLELFQKHKFKLLILAAILLAIFIIWLIFDIAENRRIDAEAVTFSEKLTVEFGEPAKVSHFLAQLNGELIDDFDIDTTKLGAQTIHFEFRNLKNKKRHREFEIEVVDSTAPQIHGLNYYTVNVGHEDPLTDLMLSGDNVDDVPKREIVGQYDLSRPGTYNVEYVITDASGNTARKPFTIDVVRPSNSSNYVGGQSSGTLDGTTFKEARQKYKSNDTKIGIDVSSWQGEINWPEVKKSGVEFAIIRVGYQTEYGADYTLDKFFKQNLTSALSAGLPVGVYFYSCADSLDEATKQAEWILAQVDGYDLELGIAFDWEEWNSFNQAGISFYTLNQIAETFLNRIAEAGYEGMIYSSKTYLDRFWRVKNYPTWLAQYYHRPTYSGDFRFWQFSDTGLVDGIGSYVDLDVLYLN